MNNLEGHKTTLTIVSNKFGNEINAILELGKTSPQLLLDNRETIVYLRELIERLLELRDDLDDLDKGLKEAQDQQKLSARWRKHWRIIACKACMGGSSIDQLLNAAFYELVTLPPADEELDKELKAIADRLEQMEIEGHDTRNLRMIC